MQTRHPVVVVAAAVAAVIMEVQSAPLPPNEGVLLKNSS